MRGGGGGGGGRGAGGRADALMGGKGEEGAAEAGEGGEGKGAEEGRKREGVRGGELGGRGDLALGQRPGLR